MTTKKSWRGVHSSGLLGVSKRTGFIVGAIVLIAAAGGSLLVHRHMLPVSDTALSHQPIAQATPLPSSQPKAASDDSSSKTAPPSSAEPEAPSEQYNVASGVQPDLPMTNSNNTGVSDCGTVTAKMQQAYNDEVRKQKDSLDSTLSILPGVNISSQYISTYNDTVAKIYTKYSDWATDDHCTFPVSPPAPLPLDYSP